MLEEFNRNWMKTKDMGEKKRDALSFSIRKPKQ